MQDDILKFLWAKSNPRKSLYCHSVESAVVTGILLKDSLFSSQADALCEWLGLNETEVISLTRYLASLHDIGKISPSFQYNDQVPFSKSFFDEHPCINSKVKTEGYRHEKGSAEIAKRIWKKEGLFPNRRIQTALSDALSLHHQGKAGKSDGRGLDPFWTSVQNTYEKKMRDLFMPCPVVFTQVSHLDAAGIILTALIILSDWIASSDFFSDTPEDSSMEETEARAHEFLHHAQLECTNKPEADHITDVWKWMEASRLRPLQKTLDEYLAEQSEMPVVLILEAPMGEGKTEAGIFAALKTAAYWKKNGMYIGLPTAATSNQMYSRVNTLLEDFGIAASRLMHSMAWLNEDQDALWKQSESSETYEELQKWLLPSKRAMLSSWAVGTVDQALMAAMRIKYGVLRLLGLAGKVLVLDEIHAYDAYMSSIIQRLLEWCKALRIPVVMLSATLPIEKKQSLLEIYTKEIPSSEGYPLITVAYASGRLEEVRVNGSYQHSTVRLMKHHYSTSDWQGTAQLAFEQVRSGGCLCLLVNTVKDAQELYCALKEGSFDGKLMLFHSRFTAARRKEIEDECIRLFGPDHSSRPAKAILVATQVVEQSLDLDFDALITELAPIDLLLQRIGRLHRHRDTLRPAELLIPTATILIPADERSSKPSEAIYYPLFLERTQTVLNTMDELHIPADIPRLVNAVYDGDLLSEKESEDYWERQFSDDFKTGQAEQLELPQPQENDFSLGHSDIVFDDTEDSWVAAKTRFDADSVRIALLPPTLYDRIKKMTVQQKYTSTDDARRVMQYSVSVSSKVLRGISDERLIGIGKLSGVLMWRSDEENEPTETISVNCGSTRMTSDRDTGFSIVKEE